MSSPPSTRPASTGRRRDQRAAQVLPGRGPDRRRGQRNRPDRRRRRSSACSGRTAPARPRPCASSPRCCRPTRARPLSPGPTFWPSRPSSGGGSATSASSAGPTSPPPAGRTCCWQGGFTAWRRRRRAPLRRAGRGLRPGPADHPAGPHLLGRAAPSARGGARHHAPAAGAVPGRADHRTRPAEPGQPVGSAPPAARRGHDDLPHHALPGRGGPAMRPAGDHRSRARHRARHPRPAQGALLGRHDHGHARCRPAGPARARAGTGGRRRRPGDQHRERGHQADRDRPDGRDGGGIRRARRAPGERAGGLGRPAVARRRVPARDRPVAARRGRRPVPGRAERAGQEVAA